MLRKYIASYLWHLCACRVSSVSSCFPCDVHANVSFFVVCLPQGIIAICFGVASVVDVSAFACVPLWFNVSAMLLFFVIVVAC